MVKVHYGEGVANHTGPELCVASREAGDEVLVGVRAGEVLSPENTATGVPTLSRGSGRPHLGDRKSRDH